MYYRRKVILSLLDAFGEKRNKLFFQKLLFLFTRMQEKPSFDFVPYKYGPFSFQSYQDKRTMTKYALLSNSEDWEKIDSNNYFNELSVSDQKALLNIKETFSEYSESQLIEYVYSNYPDYAVNSEIKMQFFVNVEQKPKDNSYTFFTIGYEGHSIDSYLHLLIKNNIKLVCDVRKNPVSMKYGFSKNQLKSILDKFEIKYTHIPELGIESNKRQQLNTAEDYKNLFIEYSNNILPDNLLYVEQLINSFIQNKRIAITCFEADYESCHRHKISEYLQNRKDWKYKIKHI